MRIAAAERTVTAVIIPADVQDMKAVEQPQSIKSVHPGIGFVRDRGLPTEEDLHKAAEGLERREEGRDARRRRRTRRYG